MNMRLQWGFRFMPQEAEVQGLGVCRILAWYADGQLLVLRDDGTRWLVAADAYGWPLWEGPDYEPFADT